jgi:hypothetical protein
MPSKSKTQQRLMGQAYAYKTGELKAKDLNSEYADEIKKLAKSMTEKQLKDFAKTKHKNLPEKVEEKIKRFDSFNESGEIEGVKVKVKDLIEYLQSLNPEINVSLDKDGWDYYETGLETVKKSSIFYLFTNDGESTLFINN